MPSIRAFVMNEPNSPYTPQEPSPDHQPQFHPELEHISDGSFPMAIVGGIAAALIGAAVWAGIAIAADLEIGILAWGLGVLTGYGVVLLGRGRGSSYALIAAACALFSVFMGKYFAVAHVLPKMAEEAQSQMAAIDPEMAAFLGQVDQATLNQALEQELGFNPADVTYFSVGAVVSFMINNASDIFSAYDLLWIALALASAWKIASRDALG